MDPKKRSERQIMGQIMAAIQEPPKKMKEKQKPRRTISGILWEKYLDKIEDRGGGIIFRSFLKISLFLLVVSWLISPETITHFARTAFEWRGYLLPKILASGVLIFQLETLGRICHYIVKILCSNLSWWVGKNRTKKKNNSVIECINGIPHNEVITHLLETGNFKRAEIEQKFGIPRRKYEGLAKALEKLGIIRKDPGQNNAFVFVPEFTRQDLANIFSGKTDAQDLEKFAARIEQTVILSPTPNFTKTKIA